LYRVFLVIDTIFDLQVMHIKQMSLLLLHEMLAMVVYHSQLKVHRKQTLNVMIMKMVHALLLINQLNLASILSMFDLRTNMFRVS
jgi:hypothetical protein